MQMLVPTKNFKEKLRRGFPKKPNDMFPKTYQHKQSANQSTSKFFFFNALSVQTATNMFQHVVMKNSGCVSTHQLLSSSTASCCFNSNMMTIAQTFKLVHIIHMTTQGVITHALSLFVSQRSHSSRLDIKASRTSDATQFKSFVIRRSELAATLQNARRPDQMDDQRLAVDDIGGGCIQRISVLLSSFSF